MIHIVLYQPEIPPNTGNVMRLCANTGCMLHLIEPLGFEMDDARMRRAGLDYRDLATVARHPSLDAFTTTVAPVRLLTFSTHHRVPYTVFRYAPGDALLFYTDGASEGSESLVTDTGEDRLRAAAAAAVLDGLDGALGRIRNDLYMTAAPRDDSTLLLLARLVGPVRPQLSRMPPARTSEDLTA